MWTAIGLAIVLVGLVYVSDQVSLILTPFVLALFPAALLNPVAGRLRRSRVPNALSALLILFLLLGAVVGAGAFITVALIDQVPQVVDSVLAGLDQLELSLNWSVVPGDSDSLRDLVTGAGAGLTSSTALTQGRLAATAVGSFFTGLVLMLVTLFFFFKDGRRIWQAFLDFVPARHQERVDIIAAQSFWTIGAFFRAQLLVALVDAVFIGLGLWVLGVPLVLPLTVLVFLGGLFPIVGGLISGSVAVVVALADRGPLIALLMLAVVLLVQQLEGNVLEPFIQGRIISLHPLVIILAVTTGTVLMGILGAFLAVPVAAVIARLIDNLRGRPATAGPQSTKRQATGKKRNNTKTLLAPGAGVTHDEAGAQSHGAGGTTSADEASEPPPP